MKACIDVQVRRPSHDKSHVSDCTQNYIQLWTSALVYTSACWYDSHDAGLTWGADSPRVFISIGPVINPKQPGQLQRRLPSRHRRGPDLSSSSISCQFSYSALTVAEVSRYEFYPTWLSMHLAQLAYLGMPVFRLSMNVGDHAHDMWESGEFNDVYASWSTITLLLSIATAHM